MDKAAQLRQLVAPLAGVGPADLGGPLGGRLKTSIGRATLEAVLRREFGVGGPGVLRAATYADLEAAVLGTAPPPAAAAASPGPDRPAETISATGSAPGCGVDVEQVAALPAAADYWADAFYQANFTPAELAYCVRQDDPRPHLAARWCAKEALAKADPAFAGRPFAEVEVVRGDGGAVRLAAVRGGVRRDLPHAVSLSHTADTAVAVVVGAVRVAAPPAGTPAPPAPPAPARRGPGYLLWAVTTLLAAAALVLAALPRLAA